MKIKSVNAFKENLKCHTKTKDRISQSMQQEINEMYKKISNRSKQIGSNINEQR